MFKALFGSSRSKNGDTAGTRLKMLQKLQLNLTLVCMVSVGALLIFSIFSATPLKDERMEDVNQTTNAIGFEVKSIPLFPSRIDAQVNLVNTSLRADFRLIDEGNNTLFTSRDSLGEKTNRYNIPLNTKSGRYYLIIENITDGTAGDRIDLQNQSVQVHYIININFLASLYPYVAILCLIIMGVALALLYRTYAVKKLVEGETKKLAVAELSGESLQQAQQPQMQGDIYPTSYGPPQSPTQPYYPPYPMEAGGGEAGEGQYYPPGYQYPGDARGYYPQQGSDENIPQESLEPIVSQQPPKVMNKKRTEEKKRAPKLPAPAEKVIKEETGDVKDIEYKIQRPAEKPAIVKCQLCGFENELTKPNIGAEAKCRVCGHIIETPKSKQTF